MAAHDEHERNDRHRGHVYVDQEARDMAARALQLLSSHETLCTERWNQSRKALDDVKKTLSALWKQQWIAAGGVVSVLLAIVYILLARVLPAL